MKKLVFVVLIYGVAFGALAVTLNFTNDTVLVREPTADNHPATKKYVDEQGGVTNMFQGAGTSGLVSSAEGDAGKFLKADGSWDDPGGSTGGGGDACLASNQTWAGVQTYSAAAPIVLTNNNAEVWWTGGGAYTQKLFLTSSNAAFQFNGTNFYIGP